MYSSYLSIKSAIINKNKTNELTTKKRGVVVGAQETVLYEFSQLCMSTVCENWSHGTNSCSLCKLKIILTLRNQFSQACATEISSRCDNWFRTANMRKLISGLPTLRELFRRLRELISVCACCKNWYFEKSMLVACASRNQFSQLARANVNSHGLGKLKSILAYCARA